MGVGEGGTEVVVVGVGHGGDAGGAGFEGFGGLEGVLLERCGFWDGGAGKVGVLESEGAAVWHHGIHAPGNGGDATQVVVSVGDIKIHNVIQHLIIKKSILQIIICSFP